MENLPTDTFQIVQLTSYDVQRASDNMKIFSSLIGAHDDMYPGIDVWLRKKVLPGIKDGERVAYIGFENGRPLVSCVLKKGEVAKFCHLHIADGFQNVHLGEVFFTKMALDIRNVAREVYFTLPESLWQAKHSFFSSFGFENAHKADVQYRLFDEELQCSAPFQLVWEKALDKLPKLVSWFSNSVLLSIQPQHASRIMSGEKSVEIRTRFSRRWKGSRAAIYSTSPTKAIVGHARIADVVEGDPDAIWSTFNVAVGCSKDEFASYTGAAKRVFAIVLDDVQAYEGGMGVPISQIQYLLSKDLVAPQSYFSLSNNTVWTEGLTIAELLHGKFRSVRDVDEQASALCL